ncbi:MAG: hypothetical protein PHW33_00325 [Candidatus Portnoybacteria bacterium]|jgi:hypothetical protein|nr:hypothetical protein [Candidatus Portnoybacteria bacterium]
MEKLLQQEVKNTQDLRELVKEGLKKVDKAYDTGKVLVGYVSEQIGGVIVRICDISSLETFFADEEWRKFRDLPRQPGVHFQDEDACPLTWAITSGSLEEVTKRVSSALNSIFF